MRRRKIAITLEEENITKYQKQLDHFSKRLAEAKYTERTAATYRWQAERFLEYFKRSPKEVSEKEIATYIKELQKKGSGYAARQAAATIPLFYSVCYDSLTGLRGVERGRVAAR
jgi:site-specific recombinase XerD